MMRGHPGARLGVLASVALPVLACGGSTLPPDAEASDASAPDRGSGGSAVATVDRARLVTPCRSGPQNPNEPLLPLCDAGTCATYSRVDPTLTESYCVGGDSGGTYQDLCAIVTCPPGAACSVGGALPAQVACARR